MEHTVNKLITKESSHWEESVNIQTTASEEVISRRGELVKLQQELDDVMLAMLKKKEALFTEVANL